jgi:hypothetical protein
MRPSRPVLSNSQAVIQEAVAGRGHRGEQDEMLRIEAKFPGFGGFYRDNSGSVVAYVKPMGFANSAEIRAALHQAYSARSEAGVREAMAGAAQARVVDAQFSLSELVTIENRIATPVRQIPGFAGVGVSVFLN